MNTLNRRQFMRMGASVAGNAAFGRPATGQSVSVTDFGADKSGRRDATASVTAAIAHLGAKSGQTLLFPAGTYRLSSAQQAAISLTSLANVEIDGGGSTLLMGNDALCLAIDRCSGVTVRNLSIDWDPLPYTQGTISSSGMGWFEMSMDDGFPVVAGNKILAIESYDRKLKNIARSGFQVNGDKVLDVQAAAGGRTRVRFASMVSAPLGAAILIRFKGNHDAIRITRCQNTSFSDVILHSSHSMGYNVSLSKDLAFRQCGIILPQTGQRLLSTNADGMHITNCSGSLAIDQCTFEATGDDAINVNAAMWHIQRTGAGGAVLVNRSGTPLSKDETPGPQEQLEVMDAADLHILQHGDFNQMGASPINALLSDPQRVPATVISRSQFRGNHSRSILAHAHLQVRDCSFQNSSLAAIMIAPDSHWMEGPGTQDIVIDTNQFSGCHYGSHDPEGTVTIDVEQTFARRGIVSKGSARNVAISNNIFNDCYTAAISCRSVDGLTIRGNRIGQTWVGGPGGPAIEASALANSTIRNNSSTANNTIKVQDSETTIVTENQGFA